MNSAARSAARSIWRTLSRSRSSLTSSSSTALCPRITSRMLLKSCAMPPARLPIDSNFCDCRSCASSLVRSVISRAMVEAPMSVPLEFLIGETVSATSICLPSLRVRIVSYVGTGSPRPIRSRIIGSSSDCVVRESAARCFGRRSRPRRSRTRARPPAFQVVTVPSSDLPMIASSVDVTIAPSSANARSVAYCAVTSYGHADDADYRSYGVAYAAQPCLGGAGRRTVARTPLPRPRAPAGAPRSPAETASSSPRNSKIGSADDVTRAHAEDAEIGAGQQLVAKLPIGCPHHTRKRLQQSDQRLIENRATTRSR